MTMLFDMKKYILRVLSIPRIISIPLVALLLVTIFIFVRYNNSYEYESNGRIEIARIDISTKYPGRIIKIMVGEGDNVNSGDILAKLDDADIKTQLLAAEAQRKRAISTKASAEAQLNVRKSSEKLAQLELKQAGLMRAKNLVSAVELERRQISLEAETAGVSAALSAVSDADAAIAEVDAQIARLNILLSETNIRAPINGQIEYKVFENNSVIPEGARIFTLLDTKDANMSLFLPSNIAGRIKIGTDATIKLDAYPNTSIPAHVSFIAFDSQFTPKFVETHSEREKLVFRTKIKVKEEFILKNPGFLKGGMPGVGIVYLDKDSEITTVKSLFKISEK